MTPERDNPIVELRQSVDALTKDIHHAFTQHEVEFAGKRVIDQIIKREDPNLSEQLRRAIGSNLGGIGGAGRLARERTPVDVAAFTLYEDIDGRVRAWLEDAGVRPSPSADPASILRRWYVLWKQKPKEDAAIVAHIQILNRWATSIRDLLDPPVKQELTQRCPQCSQMWATVGKGEESESVRALWAVWREDPDESYATCRACAHIWLGVGNMRLLRIALDDAEVVA